eukprot:3341009-Amphidinium_carterae.1
MGGPEHPVVVVGLRLGVAQLLILQSSHDLSMERLPYQQSTQHKSSPTDLLKQGRKSAWGTDHSVPMDCLGGDLRREVTSTEAYEARDLEALRSLRIPSLIPRAQCACCS